MALYSRAETNAQSAKVLGTTVNNSVSKYTTDNTLFFEGTSTVAGAQGYETAARRVVYIDNVEAGLEENRLRGLSSPGWWEYMTYTDAAGQTRHKAQKLVAFGNAPANPADLDDEVAADETSVITITEQPTDQTAEYSGEILTFTTGTSTVILGESDSEYTGVTGTADEDGIGATFTILRDETGAISSVVVTDGGTGYIVGEEITIDGSDIGGVTVTDDLVITVATVINLTATFSVTATASVGTVVYQWQTQTSTGTRWTNISGATSDELEVIEIDSVDDGRKYRVKLTSSDGATEVISNVAVLSVS
jgi:hypothetical protein